MSYLTHTITQNEQLSILGSSLRGSLSPNQTRYNPPKATISLVPANDGQAAWNKTSTAAIDRQSWETRTGGGNPTNYSMYHGEFKPYHTQKKARPQTAPLQRRPDAGADQFNSTSTAMGGYDVKSWNARMETVAPLSTFTGSINPNRSSKGSSLYQTIELKPAPTVSPINEVAAWCKRLNDIGMETKRSRAAQHGGGRTTTTYTAASQVRPSTAQPTRRAVPEPSYNQWSTQAIDVASWQKRQDLRS